MKNKLVRLETIYNEVIFCVILEETKFSYHIKNDFGDGHIYKQDIKEIAIMGDVINEK